MQHAGRVRKAAKGQPKASKKATSGNTASGKAAGQPAQRAGATPFGYVDIWAGLVLKGQQFFPLARHLYSNRHPHLKRQNRVEEAVLGLARGLVRRLGLRALVIGDRGLGRKELLIRLAQQEQPFVFRLARDILVGPPSTIPAQRLDAYLAPQPALGQAIWQRGAEPALPCTVRTVRATIRYSRSGRKADYCCASSPSLTSCSYSRSARRRSRSSRPSDRAAQAPGRPRPPPHRRHARPGDWARLHPTLPRLGPPLVRLTLWKLERVLLTGGQTVGTLRPI